MLATVLTLALTLLLGLGGVAQAQSTPDNTPIIPCFGDFDENRRVTVAELVLAVNNLLNGCPGTTPVPTMPPRTTPTPGSVEVQILQTVGHDLIPAPDRFGCSANQFGDTPGHARLTCELPVAFAVAFIERFDDGPSAAEDFNERRGDLPLSLFHGYDAFEVAGEGIGGAPSLGITWRSDRWVLSSTQITTFANIDAYLDIAERVFAEATRRGLFAEAP